MMICHILPNLGRVSPVVLCLVKQRCVSVGKPDLTQSNLHMAGRPAAVGGLQTLEAMCPAAMCPAAVLALTNSWISCGVL